MKELPEAEYVRACITLRRMDMPPEVTLTKRSLLRWFALSSGLITERESRSTILEVLDTLFYFHFSKEEAPSTKEIQEHLEKKEKPISEKLLRYHLKRLIELRLIRRKNMKYLINNAPQGSRDDIKEAFHHHVTKQAIETLNDIESVLGKLSESYRK